MFASLLLELKIIGDFRFVIFGIQVHLEEAGLICTQKAAKAVVCFDA